MVGSTFIKSDKMANTITIAGVNCRLDRLGSSITYETIFNMAIKSGRKPADIHRELTENGFTKIKEGEGETQEGNESAVHRKPSKKRSSKKRGADNKSGKGEMEKGKESTQ